VWAGLVSDREVILHLIYRYAEMIDAGDFQGVGELLGRAAFGGPRTPKVSGADNIAAVFAATTRRFDDGTPKTRHLVLNPIVEITGDVATARSTFCVVQATERIALQPIVVGRYIDRFARDPALGWHFTERIADVQMVGDVSDHLLIDPHSFDRMGD
jgi:3-phenylpropionate/cinnamic acid dioxygenase small subunit